MVANLLFDDSNAGIECICFQEDFKRPFVFPCAPQKFTVENESADIVGIFREMVIVGEDYFTEFVFQFFCCVSVRMRRGPKARWTGLVSSC